MVNPIHSETERSYQGMKSQNDYQAVVNADDITDADWTSLADGNADAVSDNTQDSSYAAGNSSFLGDHSEHAG